MLFMSIVYLFGIEVEHPIIHVHTKKILVESLIKCLKLVVRSLLMRVNLPIATWGHYKNITF